MAKDAFIKKFCAQTAIYWGSPVKDGHGGFTYAVPVNIKVRWDEKRELITDARSESQGREIVSKAEILLFVDLDLQGYLKLGSTEDFGSGDDITDPMKVAGAYPIRNQIKEPFVKSTTAFVRTVWI